MKKLYYQLLLVTMMLAANADYKYEITQLLVVFTLKVT